MADTHIQHDMALEEMMILTLLGFVLGALAGIATW